MEYVLKSGVVLTDDDIDYLADATENGKLPGNGWSGPAVYRDQERAHESTVTVAVELPVSVVQAIDNKASNRSEYIRKAIEATL